MTGNISTGYEPKISGSGGGYYQKIKFDRVETMDMGISHWNNGVSGKCNCGKYYGTYCTR